MATVYSTINLSSKSTFNPAIGVSEAGEVTVCTEDYVEVFNFNELPEIQSEHMSRRVTRITSTESPHVLKTGLDIHDIIPTSEEYLRHSVAFEALLGRATNTTVQSQQSLKGYYAAKWSPGGMDPVDRCVLCCATLDNRVSIYSRQDKMHSWEEVVRLSDLLAAHMEKEYTQEPYTEDSSSLVHKYTQRTHRLAVTAVEWCPHLMDNNGDGVSFTFSRYCRLATVTKSGHLVLWEIESPIQSGEGVCIQKIIALGEDVQASALSWCSEGQGHAGNVVVGCTDGRVLAVDLTDYSMLEMWPEKDNLRVTNIAWLIQDETVLVTKGSYLILLSIESSKDFTVLHKSTQRITGKLPITGLTLSGNQRVYISCGDASVSSGYVVGDYENDNLHVKLEPIVMKKSEAKSTRTLHNHGVAVSRNAVMVMPLQSPGEFFSNQRYPDPLKLQIAENMDPDDMVEIIMSEDHDSLLPLADILFALKYHYAQELCWPKTLDILIQQVLTGETDIFMCSVFQLRLLRFMTKIQILYLPKTSPDDAKEILECTAKNLEGSILIKHVAGALARCVECHVTEDSLSLAEKQSICAMCCYLSSVEHTSIYEEIAKLLQIIYKQLPFTETRSEYLETCIICKSTFSLVNMNEVSCEKGHKFARCCQTLLSTQNVPYRICQWCGAFAVQKRHHNLSTWWQQIQTNHCTFCDHTLVTAL